MCELDVSIGLHTLSYCILRSPWWWGEHLWGQHSRGLMGVTRGVVVIKPSSALEFQRRQINQVTKKLAKF